MRLRLRLRTRAPRGDCNRKYGRPAAAPYHRSTSFPKFRFSSIARCASLASGIG